MARRFHHRAEPTMIVVVCEGPIAKFNSRIYHLPNPRERDLENSERDTLRNACMATGSGKTGTRRLADGRGYRPCRRCFSPTGRARAKYRPRLGWLTWFQKDKVKR